MSNRWLVGCRLEFYLRPNANWETCICSREHDFTLGAMERIIRFSKRPCIAVLLLLCLLIAAFPVSAQNFSAVKTIDVDTAPFGIAPSPDGRTMWVANSGGVPAFGGPPNSNTITIIDVATLDKEAKKIAVGNFPEDIAFTNDGAYAVVTNSTDGTVSIIETASRRVIQTLSIAPLGLGFPFGAIFTKNDKKIFITTGGGFDQAIAVLDSRDINHVQLAKTIQVSGYPGRPFFRPTRNVLLLPASPVKIGTAELFVVDPESDRILRKFSMSVRDAFANDVAVTPDGRFAYVSIFAFKGGAGGVWVVDLRHLKTITMIDTGDPSVFGMGSTPDGRFIFATNFRQNQVVVISPKTRKVIATIPVGRHPNKVAVTLDGKEAFVTNQGETTVSVISIPTK